MLCFSLGAQIMTYMATEKPRRFKFWSVLIVSWIFCWGALQLLLRYPKYYGAMGCLFVAFTIIVEMRLNKIDSIKSMIYWLIGNFLFWPHTISMMIFSWINFNKNDIEKLKQK